MMHPLYKRVFIALLLLSVVWVYFIIVLVVLKADEVGGKLWPGLSAWFAIMSFIDRIVYNYTKFESGRHSDNSTTV